MLAYIDCAARACNPKANTPGFVAATLNRGIARVNDMTFKDLDLERLATNKKYWKGVAPKGSQAYVRHRAVGRGDREYDEFVKWELDGCRGRRYSWVDDRWEDGRLIKGGWLGGLGISIHSSLSSLKDNLNNTVIERPRD